MRIVNLMEDTAAENGCNTEHGLSFYIETEHHTMLVDTGASGAFLSNAERLGIDIKKVDTVILTHGHYDHGGGILSFTQVNPEAKIYIRENAFAAFYHGQDEKKRYIGLDKRVKELPQVVHVNGNRKINEELYLFTNVSGRRLWPSGNLELFCEKDGRLAPDNFSHEQYVVISCKDRKILISGCAHNGILNILDEYKKVIGGEPDLVISGFHMMRKASYEERDIKVIEETAKELKDMHTQFYTCHCTGEKAYGFMRAIMGEKVRYIRSGKELKVQ